MDSAIRKMVLHRESSLMAIALDDLNIEIMDIVTRKIVRKFKNVHQNQLTDLTFSNDSRWMITASLDKTLKVWDVPTGN
jgi:U3 small nucleolar RNA-associated protein 21